MRDYVKKFISPGKEPKVQKATTPVDPKIKKQAAPAKQEPKVEIAEKAAAPKEVKK